MGAIAYNEDDLETAAKTVFGEARGEPHAGKVAVAWVIRNRSQRHGFAFAVDDDGERRDIAGEEGAVTAVCLAPWQFSCWNKNDPNLAVIEALNVTNCEEFNIVKQVFDDLLYDPTGGADFYYAPRGMPGGNPPYWAKDMRQTAAVGNQLFFNSQLKP